MQQVLTDSSNKEKGSHVRCRQFQTEEQPDKIIRKVARARKPGLERKVLGFTRKVVATRSRDSQERDGGKTTMLRQKDSQVDVLKQKGSQAARLYRRVAREICLYKREGRQPVFNGGFPESQTYIEGRAYSPFYMEGSQRASFYRSLDRQPGLILKGIKYSRFVSRRKPESQVNLKWCRPQKEVKPCSHAG